LAPAELIPRLTGDIGHATREWPMTVELSKEVSDDPRSDRFHCSGGAIHGVRHADRRKNCRTVARRDS
jgi:hypothetical protein